MRKKVVVVAMSGGVDSAVSASILINQGYEVIGISMRLAHFDKDKGSTSYYCSSLERNCCGIKSVDDARGVAHKLGIPFYVVDCEEEFREEVIAYFCDEYMSGRTPNPCVLCNERIKFGVLLKKAVYELGADYVATGHYASVEFDNVSKRYLLKKGKDAEHDQSYFLFSLSQEQLSRISFPLKDYTKDSVRKIAKELGLRVYNKPSSQEICFIPFNNYCEFLKRYLPRNSKLFQPGPIVNTSGKVVGEHKGIAFYTIGQRKGIGAHGKPFYVVSIIPEKNMIVIGEEEELYRDELIADKVNWIDRERLDGPLKVKAKIRYKHPESDAVVSPIDIDGGKVKVKFSTPQRAITPGQAVVFYVGDVVSGGGWILC
jgi:tRNA-specific 2-thiouridylase